MKIVKGLGVIGSVAMTLAVLGSPAKAQNGNGALVIKAAPDFCILLDATCENAFLINNPVVRILATPSGQAKALCEGQLPPEATLPSNGAMICSPQAPGFPFPCVLPSLTTGLCITEDFFEFISPSGHVNFQCHCHSDQ